MRTLFEIIECVKDRGRPTYEELRWALLALEGLHYFDQYALYRLWRQEADGKYNPNLFGLEWQLKESLRRAKEALNTSPDKGVGEGNDPDNPEYQRQRKAALALFKKLEEKLEKDVVRKKTGDGRYLNDCN